MNSLKCATLVTFVAGLGLFLATTSAAAATVVADRVNDQTGVQGQSGDLDRNSQIGDQGPSQNEQTGDQGARQNDQNDQTGDQGQMQSGQTGEQGRSGE